MTAYAHPRTLIETDWLADHLDDPQIRIVEVDVDTTAYDEGHIPGAVGWNWSTQLCDTVRRDILSKAALERLLGASGIDNETDIILYGDHDNWFACWAFWQLKIFGHAPLRILNGGRKKWMGEERQQTTDVPSHPAASYTAAAPDDSLRAYLDDVQNCYQDTGWGLIDVRSPDEFCGRILSPPGLPETCQRGGHIPGARNIPWGENCNRDGTFKSRRELEQLYRDAGIGRDQSLITYCRIGERSSLSWFVLTYLLGRRNVRNYDGSWTEWGNLVGAPIETGEEP